MPRDKTPGLLHPLPIPDHPWQHISVDFKEMLPDKLGNNIVYVFVCRFSKRPISIPCNKKVNTKSLAALYIAYIYKYFGPATTIVSDSQSLIYISVLGGVLPPTWYKAEALNALLPLDRRSDRKYKLVD